MKINILLLTTGFSILNSTAFLLSSSSYCKNKSVKNVNTNIFLSMQSESAVAVTPGVIIGGGRIGSYLFEANNGKDLLISSRGTAVPTGESGPIGPIYVCTRNNDLDAIIDSTPVQRREDLVFLQNGILTEFLESKGLSENTQALIYFAVSKKGEKPIDGKTDLNPDGLTAVTGKWGKDLAARLNIGGLACHVYEKKTWEIAMLEKHVWICAFMAVGSKHKCTVGEVEKLHNAEVRAVIAELAAAAAKRCKVSFPAGVEDRLCAYARSVAHFPTALKEFEWRNGWFMDFTLESLSRLRPDPSPLHTELIMAAEGNLFFQAKKAFAARKDAAAKINEKNFEIYRELEAYESYIQAKNSQANGSAPPTSASSPPTSPVIAKFQERL